MVAAPCGIVFNYNHQSQYCILMVSETIIISKYYD
jgi:hypothetical protein